MSPIDLRGIGYSESICVNIIQWFIRKARFSDQVAREVTTCVPEEVVYLQVLVYWECYLSRQRLQQVADLFIISGEGKVFWYLLIMAIMPLFTFSAPS